MSGGSDSLVVCSACLADLLRPYIEEHRRRFADTSAHIHNSYITTRSGSWNDDGSAHGSLAREAGTSARRVSAIMRSEFATTSVWLADDLLVAIDRPDLLRVLTVFERPKTAKRMGGWSVGVHICDLGVLRVTSGAFAPAASGQGSSQPSRLDGSLTRGALPTTSGTSDAARREAA